MRKITGVIILLSIVLVALAGCSSGVSKDKYNKVTADLVQARQNLVDQEKAAATLQQELTAAKADLTTSKADLATEKELLRQAQAALAAYQSGSPSVQPTPYQLKEFTSVEDLQKWIDSHLQPAVTTAGAALRLALKTQGDAASEGYLISVNFDFDDATKTYFVRCSAFAEKSLCYWNPTIGTMTIEYPGGQLSLP